MKSQHAVLMGNPLFFRIKFGRNPFTRNSWGLRKQVNSMNALEQWKVFKDQLEAAGARVFVLQPQKAYPSMVFPANAGFLHPKYDSTDMKKKVFYLSRLTTHRSDEVLVYHQFFEALGCEVRNLPHAFEGEADFFPCGDAFIFSYGDIVPMGFKPRMGMPPWQYQFSHRSDQRNEEILKKIVHSKHVIPIKLIDTYFYHGDTAMFAFGKKREHLIVYLEAMDQSSRARLKKHFGKRLIPISKKDAFQFVANSFQLNTSSGPHLFIPETTSSQVIEKIRSLKFPFTKVDVSEFFTKGGGSIKCLLCDLGPYSDSNQVK